MQCSFLDFKAQKLNSIDLYSKWKSSKMFRNPQTWFFVSDIVSTEKKLEKMCLLFLMIPIVCLTRLTLYIVFYPQNGIWIQNYYSWSQNDGEKWSKNTVWPGPIWIKVKKSWLLLPQHQSSYPRGPEYVSIEIPPFRPHFITFSKTGFY